MSRSGYSDDCDDDGLAHLYWMNTQRALNGKRGQAFLREMLAALDAMPVKRLIDGELVCEDGVCAIGAVAVARGTDVSDIEWSADDDYPDASVKVVAKKFGIAESLVRLISHTNDDDFNYRMPQETPEQRWSRVRAWVAEKIKPEEKP